MIGTEDGCITVFVPSLIRSLIDWVYVVECKLRQRVKGMISALCPRRSFAEGCIETIARASQQIIAPTAYFTLMASYRTAQEGLSTFLLFVLYVVA